MHIYIIKSFEIFLYEIRIQSNQIRLGSAMTSTSKNVATTRTTASAEITTSTTYLSSRYPSKGNYKAIFDH